MTSYEEVKIPIEDEPEEENFAKINIRNGDHDYFIEVREKTGEVYYNGDLEPRKWKDSSEEMIMSEMAEYFRSELTPEAKEYVDSLYKKPTSTENIVWQSEQTLGNAKMIQNAESDYTFMTFDKDFRKWVKVADCVGYTVKSDSTYDYITLTLANGQTEYYNQFGKPLTKKQLKQLGIGVSQTNKGYGGPSM